MSPLGHDPNTSDSTSAIPEPHIAETIGALLDGDEDLGRRLLALRSFSRRIRSAEYHLTNACNIRCKGCWFFAYDFDGETREETSLESWQEFASAQARVGVTSALLIGGEPTLHPDRVAAFVDVMPFVTVSSNGLRPLPVEGFENVNVALTIFGGGDLDDELRGIKPSGQRFQGLFDTALRHYKGDDRAIFIYAITPDGHDRIEETVGRIHENGNQVTFNFYSPHGLDECAREDATERLLEEALRVRELFPDSVVCHPYYIRTLLRGSTEWGRFGYDVCPSISVNHPAHAERVRNGNPVLPGFSVWAADTKTLQFCCTSGHCDECRDSQAVYSWLLMSMPHFLESKERLRTWLEIAESYWEQFVWSPYHRRAERQRAA